MLLDAATRRAKKSGNRIARNLQSEKHSELASSSGSAEQEKTTQDPTTSKVLLEVFDRDILTSERIRSTDMLKALQEKYLDKGRKTNGMSIKFASEDSGNGHKSLNVFVYA